VWTCRATGILQGRAWLVFSCEVRSRPGGFGFKLTGSQARGQVELPLDFLLSLRKASEGFGILEGGGISLPPNQRRFKGPGQFWTQAGLRHLCALDDARLNNHWDALWLSC